jgi:hypothetical protein
LVGESRIDVTDALGQFRNLEEEMELPTLEAIIRGFS